MISALLDGRALTLGELARVAGVGPSTASEHVTALASGGLVRELRQGRHRYVELSGPDVAAALEALALIAPATPVRSLRQSREAQTLSAARTCYDHLAGRLGVAVHDALVGRGWLAVEPGYALTAAGEEGLAGLGVDLDAARARRRPEVRPCLDWTERRHHLAGSVGAALTATMLAHGWVERHRAGRGLRVTPAGEAMLVQRLGLPTWAWSADPAPARAAAP
jgi:hypothetical protein